MTDTDSHTATNSSFPPSDWVETTLGEVCEITSSKRIFANEYQTSGIPFFRGKEITEKFNGNEISTELFITEEKYNEIKNNFGVPEENDILLTSVGTLGNPYLVEKNLKFYFKDGNLTWFRRYKNIIPKWLYYRIISPQGKESLSHSQIGSTQQAYTIVSLKKSEISLPPLPEQQAIASVLSAFDDKIELLREQNKTLEEMGQVIFQEWFGKYKVDGEGREGGQGQLPEGWRIFELSEIVDIMNGYAYKGSDLVENSNEALVTLKSFDRNGGFQTRGFKPFIGKPKEIQEVKIGDLVVAHTDLTQDAEVLGNPAFIFDDGGFQKMFITMDLVKVVSKDENITNAFLYYLMKTKEFKGHCVGYANGTTVLHLSKKAIPEYQIALPENFEILSDVSLLLKETTDKIADINSQIQTLANTRDEILPKLMSGILRVNDFSNN